MRYKLVIINNYQKIRVIMEIDAHKYLSGNY